MGEAEVGMMVKAQAQRAMRRGQSIFEYMMVLALVLAAIAVAAKDMIKPAIEKSMTESKDVIESSSGMLKAKVLGK